MMKTLILITIVSLTVSSCVTQRKCNNRFPPQRDTIRIETVRDSIVYKDKIIEVSIPGDLRIDSVVIPCPPPPPSYIPDTARAETEFARALAWFKYPSIRLKLEQKETVLQIRLDSAVMEAYHWKSLYEKITVTPAPVKYVPKFYKSMLTISFFIIFAALIFIGSKISKYLKP